MERRCVGQWRPTRMDAGDPAAADAHACSHPQGAAAHAARAACLHWMPALQRSCIACSRATPCPPTCTLWWTSTAHSQPPQMSWRQSWSITFALYLPCLLSPLAPLACRSAGHAVRQEQRAAGMVRWAHGRRRALRRSSTRWQTLRSCPLQARTRCRPACGRSHCKAALSYALSLLICSQAACARRASPRRGRRASLCRCSRMR